MEPYTMQQITEGLQLVSRAPITEGSRNVTLTREVGGKIKDGKTPEQVRLEAHERNRSFVPPLTPAEVDIIVNSVFQTAKSRGSMLTPAPLPCLPLQGNLVSRFQTKPLFIDGNSLNTDLPRIDYIIKGSIESSATCMLFGPSGGAKTFNALDMALCCATGKPWNERATKQGIVIYFNGEGQSGISRRVKAWSIKNGNPDLNLFHVSKQVISFESDLQVIIEEIRSIVNMTGFSLVLIVIDTLSRHLNGLDENSSRDCMKFLNIINNLIEHFVGSSIAFIHHTGVDTEQVHRARGSSALKAACDSEISCNKGQLICTKMKDGEMFKPIDFKLEQIDIGIDEDSGDNINSCVVVYGERSESNLKPFFTATEKVGINALVSVSKNENRIVNNMYVANFEAWRNEFYLMRRNEEPEVKSDALRQAFTRIVRALTIKKAVNLLNNDSVVILEDRQQEINGSIAAQNMLSHRAVTA